MEEPAMMTSREPQPDISRPTPDQELSVVVCEDHALTRHHLVAGLGTYRIRVHGVPDGAALTAYLASHDPDILILDIGLPGEDGYSIAARLHRERPHLGIVMLTARDQMDDRIQGLDCGADLYFTKPVDLRELVSAMGGLQRRLRLNRSAPASADWQLDVLRSALRTPSGASVALTDNELRFLAPLFQEPGTVIPRERLSRALEQVPDMYAMRRMETMLSRLRAKVRKASPDVPLPIQARHGQGYAFVGEVPEACETAR